jgi:hypothetical protein
MSNPPSMPWVKLHTSLLDDSRFARLDDACKCRYFQLLMLAGKLDAGGCFIEHGQELSEEDLAWKLRIQADVMREDLAALSRASLACKNGHGWAIMGFEDEQGPAQADKRAAWRERQNKHRGIVTSDTSVTHADVTPLESESESESESEEESEEESSVLLSLSQQKTTDDDQSLTVSKSDLLKFIGIPKKYQAGLERDAQIKPQDLLAELARNFARQGTGKGKVGQPGYITALNLSRHEYPSAEWYDRSAWIRHLPDGITQKLGLVTQSQEEEIEQCPDVATRNAETNEADQVWQRAMDQLQEDKPLGIYRTYIQSTRAISYQDGVLQIGTAGKDCAQWLAARLTSTVTRLLVGITNNPNISVEFVSLEAS